MADLEINENEVSETVKLFVVEQTCIGKNIKIDINVYRFISTISMFMLQFLLFAFAPENSRAISKQALRFASYGR